MTERRTLAQRWRLLRRIGEGSTGTVHLAEDVRDGARVALKVIRPELARDPEIVVRVAREAAATAAIAHPSVARAIDFGCDPDGTVWLASEWVDGRSLREVLDAGALHPTRALRIARQILDALAAAHDAQVIHRDVKPENVMVIPGEGFDDERVKVLDFGIAKLDPARHGALGPGTGAGVVHGTPTYMAPEQIRREGVDGRTDLYAVGVLLHEAICGVPPFDGEDVSVLAKHLTTPPPPLSSPMAPESVTLAVRAVVGRLLAKNAAARPRSAREAIAEVDEALATTAPSQAELERASLRTGGMQIYAVAPKPVPSSTRVAAVAPAVALPPSKPEGLVRRKTAKLKAFARSYGLEPHQLVYGFAVAFGLLLLLAVVAMSASG